MIERLSFSEKTVIYKTKLHELIPYKDEILKKCEEVIAAQPGVKTDGYGYIMNYNDLNFLGKLDIKNKLDEIVQKGIDVCIELFKEINLPYNRMQTDGWVNVVRAKNPVQHNFMENMEKYHTHTEINKASGTFTPIYTYVYYVQMPNNLENEDGVLYFLDEVGTEHYILPEEGDLVIMRGDLAHAPNHALKSTKDRIVFAGNVGFEMIKKEKSLL
jgi:hypothetical protein